MRVVYLAAGAAGMLCGNCLRDNRLAATLLERGRDIVLLPLYTPIRTDEIDVSVRSIYYGGINVYLQQKSSLYRSAPQFLTRALDAPALLGGIGQLAARTRAAGLGELAVSVLRGEDGHQRGELQRLIGALRDLRPDLINLPNLMFAGIAGPLKKALDVPIVCTLGGEDLFLDQLPEPHGGQARRLIRDAAEDIDAYIAVTRYYGRHAAARFGLPRQRVQYAPLGVRISDFDSQAEPPPRPFTIGYLARVCPEKGLLDLCRALVQLRKAGRDCRVLAAGYLAAQDRPYLERARNLAFNDAGDGAFEYLGEVNRADKLSMLRGLHVLSVPSVYHEAKGLYVLEALAAGVPVVQPNHGSFPEFVEATGGGVLFDPGKPLALPEALARLMDDEAKRSALARQGRRAVREHYSDASMADQVWAIYEQTIAGRAPA